METLPEDPRLTYSVMKLTNVLEQQKHNPDPDFSHIVSHKDIVIRRYQALFHARGIRNISNDDFKSFLSYKNNHHWHSLQRNGNKVTEDMDLLREAILILVNENQPINERINKIRPDRSWAKSSMVPYLGIPIITAILMVSYPYKYGVWNNISVYGMEKMKLWDRRWENMPAGDSYIEMNSIYNQLCCYLHIDLWTLDALWWVVKKQNYS